MNFMVSEHVEMEPLSKGKMIDFEMKKSESGQYEIVDYKVSELSINTEVWIDGDVSMLMADFGMVTLNHAPVADWSWDAGELNFSVGGDIELSSFQEGDKVRFLVEKQGSDYLLKELVKSEDK